MKVYLASSWRNPHFEKVLMTLEALTPKAIEFYNFKNPSPGNYGFSWKQINAASDNWTTPEYIKILEHPLSVSAFADDFGAMQAADVCVLLLPSGRSAHIEAGYFIGANKPLIVFIPEQKTEPKLMYKMTPYVFHEMADVVKTLKELLVKHHFINFLHNQTDVKENVSCNCIGPHLPICEHYETSFM